MTKFIKLHEKNSGKTFDPVIYVFVDRIKWFKNIPTCEGENNTHLCVDGVFGTLRVTESIEEVINLINK